MDSLDYNCCHGIRDVDLSVEDLKDMSETDYDKAEKPAVEKFHVPSLLNKSECRKLALRCGEKRTGWLPNRVSAEFLDDVETKVRMLIMNAVGRHRSVGKTIKDFL